MLEADGLLRQPMRLREGPCQKAKQVIRRVNKDKNRIPTRRNPRKALSGEGFFQVLRFKQRTAPLPINGAVALLERLLQVGHLGKGCLQLGILVLGRLLRCLVVAGLLLAGLLRCGHLPL